MQASSCCFDPSMESQPGFCLRKEQHQIFPSLQQANLDQSVSVLHLCPSICFSPLVSLPTFTSEWEQKRQFRASQAEDGLKSSLFKCYKTETKNAEDGLDGLRRFTLLLDGLQWLLSSLALLLQNQSKERISSETVIIYGTHNYPQIPKNIKTCVCVYDRKCSLCKGNAHCGAAAGCML